MKQLNDHSSRNDNWIIAELTPMNFLLSMMIVFHHAFTVNVNFNGTLNPFNYGMTVSIQRFMYNLSECAVPMFFFLSAYLFYRTFDGTWQRYKEKMRRRFFSLLIPYIIFCSFGYIKHVIAANLGEANFTDWIHSLWICDTMPLWFIRELMALSILAPVLFRIKKRIYLILVISLICVALVAIGVVPYRSFLYWIPVYLMGAKINETSTLELKAQFSKRNVHLLFYVALLIYIFWSWCLPNGIKRVDMDWVIRLDFISFRLLTPMFLLYVMYILFESNVREKYYMRYSFFVYCMHFPVITILGIMLDRVVGIEWYMEMFKYIIIVIMSYTICVVMAMTLQRFMLPLWRIINGGRK